MPDSPDPTTTDSNTPNQHGADDQSSNKNHLAEVPVSEGVQNGPDDHADPTTQTLKPVSLDLKKDHGLTVQWSDGVTSFYPIAHLRRLSPSADAKELRKQLRDNPLTVLPPSKNGDSTGPLVATGAELVGRYAIKIQFSDGHHTGLYSWPYLRSIAPECINANT